jgi:hypothetical protein
MSNFAPLENNTFQLIVYVILYSQNSQNIVSQTFMKCENGYFLQIISEPAFQIRPPLTVPLASSMRRRDRRAIGYRNPSKKTKNKVKLINRAPDIYEELISHLSQIISNQGTGI